LGVVFLPYVSRAVKNFKLSVSCEVPRLFIGIPVRAQKQESHPRRVAFLFHGKLVIGVPTASRRLALTQN